MMMVAPLTTTVMTSVPQHMAGLASAVNNAISRVGPQLATAVIFVVASSIFFGTLGDLVPSLDTSSDNVRADFGPLNPPVAGTPADQVAASAEASQDAFSFAMLVAAALLFAGAIVSAIGLRDPAPAAGDQVVREVVPGPLPPCPPLDVDCVASEEAPPAAA